MNQEQQVAETNEESQNSQTEASVTVIEVNNPSPEEMKTLLANVRDNLPLHVVTKPIKFNFKKSTDKETGITTERKAVELPIPYPSVEGIVNILERAEEDPKSLELLMESMEGVVNSRVRDFLNDEEKGISYDASNFPYEELQWDKIASLPKAQRRGGGIPKETWEGFGKDYVQVMPEATDKTVDQVTNMAKILLNKLTQVKTNKPVLQLAVEQLALYVEASPNAEEFEDCVEFLLGKADTFLNVTDEQLLTNL